MEKHDLNSMMPALDAIKGQAQKYTDKILGALNPIDTIDLPFVLFSLREVAKAVEANMDKEMKEVTELLPHFIGSKTGTVYPAEEALKALKKWGGGIIDGL